MLLILGGLGIFARWPFEELCSAEDDATHPWRPWHLRQVAVRGALQRRGRCYSSLAALASSPGGRSRSSAAQRTMVLILGGLGIFARWPFEELCSAEDDCTAACIRRAWHERGVESAQRVAVEG